MIDPRNFQELSDYPSDQIIFAHSQDNLPNADGFGSHSAVIPHGLPFTPLIFGVWATNPDFSDTRRFLRVREANEGFVIAYADATNIYVDSFATNENNLPTTASIRLYGLEPSDSNAETTATNISAGSFISNSDYNYAKLFLATKVSGTGTIDHNLGFKPQVMAWREYGRDETQVIEELYNSSILIKEAAQMPKEGVEVTENSIKYWAYGPEMYHLRIYADD